MDQTQAFEWYERYKNGIYRYVLTITKDPYLAEDVLHDTFVKVLSQGNLFDPAKVQAWLYRVARNLCYDYLRKSRREQDYLLPPADGESPYTYIEMIAHLSTKEQEIVTLKIVGGLTHREIGTVLGISAKAAQKRYERAISTLREKEETDGT